MSNVMTPVFRVSYPNVFKPQVNALSKQEEYSLVALFPKDADLSKLKAAAEEAVIKKWGVDKKNWPKKMKSPFRLGEEKEKEVDGKVIIPSPYEKGAVFMTLKSKQRPGVVDEKVQDIIDTSQFYAGCWAKATLRAYAYDAAGNQGVSFGLQNIQKVKDGDPLSGRLTAQDDFAPIEGAASGAAASSLFS